LTLCSSDHFKKIKAKSSATKTQRHKKSIKYKLLSKKEEFITEKIADAASLK